MNSSQIIFTSILSSHEVTFKYTIKHCASIMGLYICLTGPENISDDSRGVTRRGSVLPTNARMSLKPFETTVSTYVSPLPIFSGYAPR
jgi:hypothetical protein